MLKKKSSDSKAQTLVFTKIRHLMLVISVLTASSCQNVSEKFAWNSSEGGQFENSTSTQNTGTTHPGSNLLKVPGGKTIDTSICSTNLQTQKKTLDRLAKDSRWLEIEAQMRKVSSKPEVISLNSAELAATVFYTIDGYQPIALTLQGNSAAFSEFKEVVSCVLSGVKKLPAKSGRVFHGEISLTSEWKTKFKKGIYTTQKFLSTTENFSLAQDFAVVTPADSSKMATVFVIESKSGRSLEAVSLFAGEGEIVLSPGQKFEVVDARLVKTGEEGFSMDALRVKMREL
jgi:hypothetical protein